MLCPFCQHDKTEVFNSRPTAQSTQVWRRRRCKSCHNAFTSYEAYDLSFLDIKQPSGQAIPYSKARLFSSIYMAFVGSKLSDADSVDNVAATVEKRLLQLKKPTLERDDVINTIVKSIKPLSVTATMRYLADHSPTDSKDPSKLI